MDTQRVSMNPLGIMQGRLSLPIPNRLQAFPWSSWEQEFGHAKAVGLNCIEWLFAAEDYEHNPLWTEAGVQRIRHVMQTHGVTVPSVCATYFMAHPFFRVSREEQTGSEMVLKRLIAQAAQLDMRVILLPVLEGAEIRTNDEAERLAEALQVCFPIAHTYGIRLALETELPVHAYGDLIRRLDNPLVGAYYDIGNATAMGYDPAHDIRVLGNAIYGVHIKDRTQNGPNVLLGNGDADFTACFAALQKIGYQGPLIMETAVGVDYQGIATAHRLFVQDHWQAAQSRQYDAEETP